MWSNRQELHDAEAERARQHLPEPTMPWRAPGARVVAVGGPPGDRVGGSVSVVSLLLCIKVYSVSSLEEPILVHVFAFRRSPSAQARPVLGRLMQRLDAKAALSASGSACQRQVVRFCFL